MKALWAIAGVLFGSLALSGIGTADEPGNPFPYADPSFQSLGPVIDQFDPPPSGRGESPEATRRAVRPEGNAEESGFKWPAIPKPKMPTLPKLSLPKLSMPTWRSETEMSQQEHARKPAGPSSWEKLSSGTKDMFTKTKQTLMPWSQADEGSSVARPATSKPRRSTARTPTRTKAKSASAEKKPLFPWFSQQETEKPISTVNDFLSQPRLQ